MREPHKKGVAHHFPRVMRLVRKDVGEALTGYAQARYGAPKSPLRCDERVLIRGRNMKGSVRRERSFDTAESETLGMCGNSMRKNREALQTPARDGRAGRSKKAKGRNVDMYVCRESDGLVVPAKRANKADAYALAAESAEGRRATKGNAPQAHSCRTQSREASHRGCGAYEKPCLDERLAVR